MDRIKQIDFDTGGFHYLGSFGHVYLWGEAQHPSFRSCGVVGVGRNDACWGGFLDYPPLCFSAAPNYLLCDLSGGLCAVFTAPKARFRIVE